LNPLQIKPYYDVVVIGAGISGLTSAAILSKAGLSVCVLEMDVRAGGYLAGFRRNNFRFDSAIHWLNQCGPGGLVTKAFDLIGTDHPRAVPQQRIRRYKGESYDYLLTNNPDELKARLIADFPHEEKGIIKFFNAAKTLGAAFHKHRVIFRSEETMSPWERIKFNAALLRFAVPFIRYIRYSGNEGTIKGLRLFFKDKRLQKLFCSETDLLSCLVPIGWAYYGDYQSPPPGGSQAFPEWLCHVIDFYKNPVCYQCKVTRILLENNTSTGVEFEHRGHLHTVKSKHVIAACDVETLYEKMLPPGTVSNKLISKLRNAKLYSSSVTVSLALDCPVEELGFNEELIFLCNENVKREDHESGDPRLNGISILAPSFRDKSLAPENQGTLTLYSPAFFDYSNHWNTDRDDNGNIVRGEEYKKLKRSYADVMINRVEEKLAPGLSKHILYCDVATPITHWRYTGNRNGSMMGAKPGRENMQAKIAHYQTPVTNLLLGGHWSDLGGGVPIAVKSAVNTALLVLKKENKEAFHSVSEYLSDHISLDEALQRSCFKPYDNSWKQEPTPAQKAGAKVAVSPTP